MNPTKSVKSFSYSNISSTVGEPLYLLLSSLSTHCVKVDKKSDLPLICLAEIEGRRGKSNVQSVTGFGLDLELKGAEPATDLPDYVQRLEHLLETISDYEYVMYSTFSHTNEDPRYRIIVPFEQPIDPKQHNIARLAFDIQTGQLSDKAKSTKTPIALHYLPHLESQIHYNPGRKRYQPDQIQDANLTKAYYYLRGRHGRYIREEELKKAAMNVVIARQPSGHGSRNDLFTRLTYFLQRCEVPLQTTQQLLYWSIWDAKRNKSRVSPEQIESMYNRAAEKPDENLPPAEEHPLTNTDQPPIVQYDQKYYILNPDKMAYMPRPLSASEVPKRLLETYPQNMRHRTERNRRLGAGEYMDLYGTAADSSIVDLTNPNSEKGTTYNVKTRTIHERPLQLRDDISPRYHPEIADWLRKLAGDQYTKLEKWLALCPDLTKTLCAIQFDGPPASGKTLFTMGVSSLWGASPTEPQALTSAFNEGLARCPIVEIDEEVADNRFNGRRLVSVLRSELSKTRRELRRKYLPPADLLGCVRVLITGNTNIITTPGHLNADSIKAISERILYLKVPREATDYLNSVQAAKRDHWARAGIAEHILELQRTIQPTATQEGRFWVLGEVSRMTRILAAVGVKGNALVSEWLTIGLLDGFERLHNQGGSSDLVHLDKNRLYVHTNAVLKYWSTYSTQKHEQPTTQMVTDALKAMALETGVRIGNDRRMQYVEIDPQILSVWATEYGAIDDSAIYDALGGERQEAKVIDLLNRKQGE